MSTQTLESRTKAAANSLPARYREDWPGLMFRRIEEELRPGIRILDVGSGRTPVLGSGRRPEGCLYAGLDISEAELKRAPEGSYDQMHVADVVQHMPELEGEFDLAVSWQVLERALANLASHHLVTVRR